MASTNLEFSYNEGFASLTVELRAVDTDPSTPNHSSTATEKTNDTGRYAVTVTEALAGWYHVRILNSGSVVARFVTYLADDTSTYYCVEANSWMLLFVDGYAPWDIIRHMAAILMGRVSGAGTGTEVFKGLDESTDRVTVSVDSSGNRDDITLE